MNTRIRATSCRYRLAGGLVLLVVVAAAAANPPAPEQLIGEITASLRAFQQRGGADKPAAHDVIVDTVVPHFDFTVLSAAMMESHWSRLSDGERRCLAAGVRERLIERYRQYVLDFDYGALESTAVEQLADGRFARVHQTFTTANPQPLILRYDLKQAGNTWRVTDLSVDGVSLAASHRAEFTEAIERDGLGDFLRTFPACRDR